MKTIAPLLLIALAPVPAFAHGVVDLAVRFVAPEYVAASSTTPVDLIVDTLAYDSADKVTIDVAISDAWVSSADPAWRCVSAASYVQCSAEELTAGPHPIHLEVKAPASGSLHALASVTTLDSSDPNVANNEAALDSRVFSPAQCGQVAPQITGNFQWSTLPGAVAAFEVFFGIDGELLHRGSLTKVPGGEVTWFVRARFDGCPALDSATASFHSTAPRAMLAVETAWSTGLVRPQSVAVDGDKVLIADGGARQIFAFDRAASTLAPLPIYGDIISDPPAFDGGIHIGPGDYLYDADTGTHSVRLALPDQRYMYFAAGQAKNPGTVDGQGNAARFDAPAAVTVDGRGQFYITDSSSSVVRQMKYNSTKFDFDVITFAGVPHQSGFADGRGTSARFNDPAGVAVDAAGIVYVTDRGNHVVRKITADGTVSTVAGTAGVPGDIDGDRSVALLNRPAGIAIDSFGNIYVTEEGNRDVRKIAPNGRVATVATGFDKPALLTIGPDGTLWIPDAGNGRLLRAVVATSERRRAASH